MVTIGNGCSGISVYYEDKEDKDKMHVPWKDVVKISYKKDKFRIIYHPPEVGKWVWSSVGDDVIKFCRVKKRQIASDLRL